VQFAVITDVAVIAAPVYAANVILAAATVHDDETVVLTAIEPVVVVCAKASEVINKPNMQVNAVVDFAIATLLILLEK